MSRNNNGLWSKCQEITKAVGSVPMDSSWWWGKRQEVAVGFEVLYKWIFSLVENFAFTELLAFHERKSSRKDDFMKNLFFF